MLTGCRARVTCMHRWWGCKINGTAILEGSLIVYFVYLLFSKLNILYHTVQQSHSTVFGLSKKLWGRGVKMVEKWGDPGLTSSLEHSCTELRSLATPGKSIRGLEVGSPGLKGDGVAETCTPGEKGGDSGSQKVLQVAQGSPGSCSEGSVPFLQYNLKTAYFLSKD